MKDPKQYTPRQREFIGAGLGLITATFTAIFLVCFLAATKITGRSTVVFALLLAAAFLNSIVVVFRPGKIPRPTRTWLYSALFLAAMTVIGNVFLAVTLPLLGPGVTSTMMQLQVFFVAAGAWVFLKEKVAGALLVGAALAASGFASFALPQAGSAALSVSGLVGGLVTALCFASMIVWTRAVIHDLDPVSLNAGRLWVSTLVMALWPGVLTGASEMSLRGWLLAAGAAASGPFFARLALMYSLRFISAAQTKLWSMLSPVFAFLLVFLLYGTLPGGRELIGGALIVGGVLLPTLLRYRRDLQ